MERLIWSIMSSLREMEAIIAEAQLGSQVVHLIEIGSGVVILRRTDLSEKLISESGPLFSDIVALSEARDLFPEQFPLLGMPVDGR